MAKLKIRRFSRWLALLEDNLPSHTRRQGCFRRRGLSVSARPAASSTRPIDNPFHRGHHGLNGSSLTFDNGDGNRQLEAFFNSDSPSLVSVDGGSAFRLGRPERRQGSNFSFSFACRGFAVAAGDREADGCEGRYALYVYIRFDMFVQADCAFVALRFICLISGKTRC